VGGFRLGPNPGLQIRDVLGEWGLRFLLLTLAMTPLRLTLGRPWPLRFRRLLGLWSFAYVLLHFVTYFFLDRSLELDIILEDITKRPFITLGFAALLLMVPLVVTSTAGWQRRLGPRWSRLHRLVYLVAILGCWHYYWLVKQDVREPLLYAAVLAVLLGVRLLARGRRGRPGIVEKT
jgi:sulfoxide reductase heme-binding subunit YedZ